jgi:hypothetical protein
MQYHAIDKISKKNVRHSKTHKKVAKEHTFEKALQVEGREARKLS